MIELLQVPETINQGPFILLVALSLFTSMLSASLGIGGGTILIAAMAQIVPITAVIPVHGVVQLGSNFGRTALLLKSVHWDYVAWFALGSLVGALIGGQIVMSLPVDLLRLALGVFILFSVWGPKFRTLEEKPNKSRPKLLAFGGLLSTLLTMFVGATGPFVIALIRSFKLPSLDLVSTNSACLVLQHTLKIVVFGLLGFAFEPYLMLILLMLASGFIGTIIGRKILISVNERLFQTSLNIILSVLAIRLLLTALW